MALWSNIINNDAGSSVRDKLNKLGADDELTIRVVSQISEVANEINYFETNTIVFAIAEKDFYTYNGSAWVLDTATHDIPVTEITHLDSPYSFTTQRIILANTSGGDVLINLVSISGITGRSCKFKNVGSGTLTLDANGTETIDGSLTLVLSEDESAELVASSSEWSIL